MERAAFALIKFMSRSLGKKTSGTWSRCNCFRVVRASSAECIYISPNGRVCLKQRPNFRNISLFLPTCVSFLLLLNGDFDSLSSKARLVMTILACFVLSPPQFRTQLSFSFCPFLLLRISFLAGSYLMDGGCNDRVMNWDCSFQLQFEGTFVVIIVQTLYPRAVLLWSTNGMTLSLKYVQRKFRRKTVIAVSGSGREMVEAIFKRGGFIFDSCGEAGSRSSRLHTIATFAAGGGGLKSAVSPLVTSPIHTHFSIIGERRIIILVLGWLCRQLS